MDVAGEMGQVKRLAVLAGQMNKSGRISSISGAGDTANIEVDSNGEVREFSIANPYGISSCGSEGMGAQVIMNTGNSGMVVGVVDSDKPSVGPGETILYSASGSKVELMSDGSVKAVASDGTTVIIGGGKTTVSAGGSSVVVQGDKVTCTSGGSTISVGDGITLSSKYNSSILLGSDGKIQLIPASGAPQTIG